jgi:hypothetical protein
MIFITKKFPPDTKIRIGKFWYNLINPHGKGDYVYVYQNQGDVKGIQLLNEEQEPTLEEFNDKVSNGIGITKDEYEKFVPEDQKNDWIAVFEGSNNDTFLSHYRKKTYLEKFGPIDGDKIRFRMPLEEWFYIYELIIDDGEPYYSKIYYKKGYEYNGVTEDTILQKLAENANKLKELQKKNGIPTDYLLDLYQAKKESDGSKFSFFSPYSNDRDQESIYRRNDYIVKSPVEKREYETNPGGKCPGYGTNMRFNPSVQIDKLFKENRFKQPHLILDDLEKGKRFSDGAQLNDLKDIINSVLKPGDNQYNFKQLIDFYNKCGPVRNSLIQLQEIADLIGFNKISS